MVGREACEKGLNTTQQLGKCNFTYTEMSLHTSHRGSNKIIPPAAVKNAEKMTLHTFLV